MKSFKLTRREFLRLAILTAFGTLASNVLGCDLIPTKPSNVLRVALLHLAPQPGDLAHNRQTIETAVARAAALGADWIITPELAVSGYEFSDRIGTNWITDQPDMWTRQMMNQAKRLHATIFLGTPERDAATNLLYNSVLVLGNDGTLLGRHRKVGIVPIHAEAWSSAGMAIAPMMVDGIQVGVLICADSYKPDVAMQLKQHGAQILVSAVAWAPGECGPEGVWEDRSRETGLTLVVCNRTGDEPTMSLNQADSVIARDGQRVLQFHSAQPSILIADLNRQTFLPVSKQFSVTAL